MQLYVIYAQIGGFPPAFHVSLTDFARLYHGCVTVISGLPATHHVQMTCLTHESPMDTYFIHLRALFFVYSYFCGFNAVHSGNI